jgi:polyisoprenoid-binding protein YceI/ribosomal protein S18 acetylase RimI-like enzyme
MATEMQTEQGMVRIPTGRWRVDPTHSSVEFEIKHLMIATVRGRFTQFEGTILAAENIADSKVWGAVKAASIDTNEPTRDAHLRSPDFFDVEKYPDITFESTRIEPLGGPRYNVIGDLKIKDQTRQVQLESTVEGAQRDPWGNDRVGVRVRGSINRKDFGLTWQQILDGGTFLLGDEVKILIDLSAVRDVSLSTAAELAELYELARWTFGAFPGWSDERVRDVLRRDIVFVAHERRQPAGYVALSRNPTEAVVIVDQLLVAPGHERRGIGHRLLAHAEGYAIAERMDALRIVVERNNARARDFYRRSGFVPIEEELLELELPRPR